MKQLVPEQGVLYTFVMPKTGDKKRYEFIGETDKGRYMMRNVDEYCNVDFSQKWFAFLASRCLLHKEKSPTKIKQDDLQKSIDEMKKREEEEENKKQEESDKMYEKILEFVKTANKETQKELETLTGKSYKKILSIVCSSEFGLEQASVFNAIENKYFKVE